MARRKNPSGPKRTRKLRASPRESAYARTASRGQVLRLLAAGDGRPWSLRRLTARLGLRSASPGAKALRRLLRDLEREGIVERFDGQVRRVRRDGLIEGELRSTDCVVDVVGREWLVDETTGLRSGDRVLVWPGSAGAEIVQVVSPAADRIVGRLHIESGRSALEPFGRAGPRSLRVAKSDRGGAHDGQVVEAVGSQRGRPSRVRVVRTLGRPGSPDADFEALVWKYRLAADFPADVLREAERAAQRVGDAGERRDLTGLPFVTIDPVTARDHDDAVCVEPMGAGDLRLWVAIADVSHFVAEGGAIDREALRRGNSVYLPDRALPMLPAVLSSEACSLIPQAERPVLAVELRVAGDGVVRERAFHRARIRSRARLAYEDAAAVMEGETPREVAPELHAPLRRLLEATQRLRARRQAAGTIDLELPEAALTFDESGWPVGSAPARRTPAHRAIEEAMLAANRAVAGLLEDRGVVTVHRVHEPPSDGSLASLAGLLERFGLLSDGGAELTPRRLATALEAAAGRPVQRLVHWSVLRSMQQARYASESLGHYALGFEHYLHFTSPIRRIADLSVHRALHRVLAGEAEPPDAAARAERVAVRASLRERIAQRVEREALAIKRAALMEARLGECFDGHISGLTEEGVFVTLVDPFVDGRVDASALAAGLELEPDGLALVGRRSRRRFALGDPIRVRVEAVDTFRGQVRFGPVRS